MCGSTNSASKAAKKAEEERQRQIEEGQRRIEGIFSSPERQRQYEDFVNAQRQYLQSDLDREHRQNRLKTKFATARSGLSGGSVDVDRQTDLSELYLRGIAEAERRAQNSGANLRSMDQQSKQNLFSQLLSGGDATTAAQNAAQMMQTNAALAKQDSFVNSFDSLFGDFGDIYKRSREDAGTRRADQQLGSLFGPRAKQTINVAGSV